MPVLLRHQVKNSKGIYLWKYGNLLQPNLHRSQGLTEFQVCTKKLCLKTYSDQVPQYNSGHLGRANPYAWIQPHGKVHNGALYLIDSSYWVQAELINHGHICNVSLECNLGLLFTLHKLSILLVVCRRCTDKVAWLYSTQDFVAHICFYQYISLVCVRV